MIWIFIAAAVIFGLWASGLFDEETADEKIDDLIDQNRFRFREGMDTPDWSRVKALGQKRWNETVEAQKKCHLN